MEKNGAQVTTPTFRVSYANVFKAKKNDLNGKDEFSLVAVFAKGENLDALKKAAKIACIKKFGADESKWPTIRSPFRDHREKMKDGKLPEGHEVGGIFLNLKSTNRPQIVDQNVQEIIEEHRFYSGCYARASIGAYAYSQKGNNGVAFGLNHLQLVKDGPPMGGRPRVEDAFKAVEVETADSDAGSIFS